MSTVQRPNEDHVSHRLDRISMPPQYVTFDQKRNISFPRFSGKFYVFVRVRASLKNKKRILELSCLPVCDLDELETSLSLSPIASYSLHFKEILWDINRRVPKEIYIWLIEHELFTQSNHRSMAKLLIHAALLFFSSKTGVSSMGATTSPQQHNPQTGADKDPC